MDIGLILAVTQEIYTHEDREAQHAALTKPAELSDPTL
jgi:hypothetical protein